MRNSVLLAVALLSLSGPAHAEGEQVAVVEAYFLQFNFHDVDGMAALLTEDVRWMSIDGDQLSRVTSGRDELIDALRQYFANIPSARSRIRGITINGAYVSVVEEALWKDGDVTRRQCATSVYQISDGLIANVWYFGEQSCND